VNSYIDSGVDGCPNTDAACICSTKDFLTTISCCVAGVCDQADQKSTLIYVEQLCITAQVTALPPAGTCPSSTSSSASTSSTSTPGSACSSPLTDCGGTCIDIKNDLSNCGECANVCAVPDGGGVATCAAGECVATFSTSSSRSSSSTMSSSTSYTTSSAKNTATPSPATSSSSGLSTGAKAGIAIGVIGVIFIVLLALFLLLRRRKRQGNGNSRDALPLSYPAIGELPAEKPIHKVEQKEVVPDASKHEVKKSPTVAVQSPVSDGEQVLQPDQNHELDTNPAADKTIERKNLLHWRIPTS
jgi:LPXTG-motif cell wall-anchored protein